ncbi:S8 family peptidase [Solirubrobacter taibaiensis]|nr:S8 family peptidase [Solirubrobacter taibaiensis]
MTQLGSSFRTRFARTAGLAAAGLFMAGAFAGTASATEGQIRGENAKNAIEDSYIVVLDSDVTKSKAPTVINTLTDEHDADLNYRYTSSVQGFAAEMSEAEAKDLANDPNVAYVEQNRKVSALDTQPNPPSWGLDRIDQRDLPLNNSFSYANTASNVTAYIIDTGIRTTHDDFTGRASWGTNTTGDGNNTDCNGHGTHVAGTVGGSKYGVAKNVKLIAVKVLDCSGSGSFAGVMAGVDWVTAHHQPGQPAVANMSLGGYGANTSVENAVRTSIADGVTYAIASGNSNDNACNYTPARVAEAITVNASTNTDARASFSNYGTCTDVFAPGQNITSAWITSNSATNTISGTSMAAPHVAGAAALILGTNPSATPQAVRNQLVSDASANKVTGIGAGSPNLLLFTGAAASDGPWAGSGTATTTVNSDAAGNATLNYSVAGSSGSWTLSNTAKTARKLPVKYRYNGYHAWFQVRVAIEQFVTRNNVDVTKQVLHSAGPVNCCAAPSGGFDYSGTATFDLQPGDVYGFRMSGSHFDSDRRLLGTLTVSN